jgi:hypothetical protein
MGRVAYSSHPRCNLQIWTTRMTPSNTRHPNAIFRNISPREDPIIRSYEKLRLSMFPTRGEANSEGNAHSPSRPTFSPFPAWARVALFPKESYHSNPVDPQVPTTHLLLLRGSASSQWEGLAALTTQRRDHLAQERVVELAAVQLLFLPTAAQTGRSCSASEPTRMDLSQRWADFPTKGGHWDLVP